MITESTVNSLDLKSILKQISSYAATSAAERLILESEPLSRQRALSKGLMIDAAKGALINNAYPPLEFIPDLQEEIALSKIEGNSLDARVVLAILKLASMSRGLKCYLLSNQLDVILNEYSDALFDNSRFEREIGSVFDPQGNIRPDATEELRAICAKIRRLESEIQSLAERLLKKYMKDNILMEEFYTERDGRMVLPIKVEHKRQIPGFIHDMSQTGSTAYIEPAESLEMNNELLGLKFAKKREIERILRNLTKKIGLESDALLWSFRALTEIDSLFAKARYSLDIDGCYPSLNENEEIRLLGARHPALIKKLGIKGTVPLNLSIGSERIIIITGPNAGGKTVVLKTLGLLSLMLRFGLHIPVSPDTNMHFFESILIDIGDSQSIEEDLSTFSSHLKNIKEILRDADSNTLVLVDELGTGTDPAEGAALSMAFLTRLRDAGAVCVATTHHGSLKAFAHSSAGFKNSSMSFDSENLRPTYRFREGIPGSSYAIEIARRTGFDQDFICLARSFLDEKKDRLEKLLLELEEKSEKFHKENAKISIESSRLKALELMYNSKTDELTKEKNRILKQKKAEAENFLSEMNSRFELLLREVKESGSQDKSLHKEKRKQLQFLKEKITAQFEIPQTAGQYSFNQGDCASLINSDFKGEITEINREKNKAVLISEGIRLVVKLSDLVPAKRKEVVKSSRTQFYSGEVFAGSIKLDIRGMRASDAELELLKFLDESYSSGRQRVEILHGKGTGVLKHLVSEILRHYEQVQSFAFAPMDMGGDGVTVVTFKD